MRNTASERKSIENTSQILENHSGDLLAKDVYNFVSFNPPVPKMKSRNVTCTRHLRLHAHADILQQPLNRCQRTLRPAVR